MPIPEEQPLTCLFCGEAEKLELFEIWSDHEFMFETCCLDLHEQVAADFAEDPAWARELTRRLGAETIIGERLRRVADADGVFVLDWHPRIRPIAFGAARRFVERHHEHCAPPAAWRFGAAIWNGRTLLGVVMVGNPVARAYNVRSVLEVNRLCIRRDVANALRWNACSMLYGWAAREAQRRGFAKIITYTRADEEGTSVRAAGWEHEARIRGRSWHGTRLRRNDNAWIARDRWSRSFERMPARRSDLPVETEVVAPPTLTLG